MNASADGDNPPPPVKSHDHPRVGFVGWNPFQFLHFQSVMSRIPGAACVIEDHKAARGGFRHEMPPCAPGGVLRLDRTGMRSLDGRFDVLVCQTPFTGIEDIRTSRIAMMQYGYAKEAHNFAPWRAFGDVCLTFGPHGSRGISPFCECVTTGNPRFEAWEDPGFRREAMERHGRDLDPAKKTVLYAPTWGGLSSGGDFSKAVAALASRFNVILKVHHNTEAGLSGSRAAGTEGFSLVRGAGDDLISLLAVSDVLVTDYSGAIFDALHAAIPVVLLDSDDGSAESKSDAHSLERSRRDSLGVRAASPRDVEAAVDAALGGGGPDRESLDALRRELFINPSGAAGRAAQAILDLAAGAHPLTQTRGYVRLEMAALYRCRGEFRRLRMVRDFLRRKFGGPAQG